MWAASTPMRPSTKRSEKPQHSGRSASSTAARKPAARRRVATGAPSSRLERGNVAFGSRHPGNLGLLHLSAAGGTSGNDNTTRDAGS